MRIIRILATALFLSMVPMVNASSESTSIYDIQVKTIDGKESTLSGFRGKVLLVVNVASRCGYTSQYAGLQQLYTKYNARGFEVLGFPSNDFGGQEPGSEAEIKSFCSNTFGVTFPLFSKVSVVGAEQHPLYRFLMTKTGGAPVSWNFEKFLIDRAGNVIQRYPSRISPSDSGLIAQVETALAAS